MQNTQVITEPHISIRQDNVLTNHHANVAMILFLVPAIILFFSPSIWEFIGVFVIDTLAFIVFKPIDLRLFRRFHPEASLFFPGLSPDIAKIETLEERRKVYNDMKEFPAKRSLSLIYVSLIKIIPAVTFMMIMWGGDEHYLITAVKILGICCFTFSYSISTTYIAYQNAVSQMLQEIHEKYDWSEVFKSVPVEHKTQALSRPEFFSVSAIFVLTVCMFSVITFNRTVSPWISLVQIIYILVASAYFSYQILVTTRLQVMRGIDNIVAHFNSSEQQMNPKGLALSVNQTLAFYQQTMNNLLEKNLTSEREIVRWIDQLAENNRYTDLGKISGLLIHDLINPLNIMTAWIYRLKKSPMFARSEDFDTFEKTLNRIVTLTKNVLNTFRGENNTYRQSTASKAFQLAKDVAPFHFERSALSKIDFSFDIPDGVEVLIPQPDLIQVLLNLQGNSIKNLIGMNIENPRIWVEVRNQSDKDITFSIRDNGTGLSAETFEFITESSTRLPGQEGVGLKLTKDLVRRYGGSLTVETGMADVGGTSVLLKLQKAPEYSPVPGI